MFATHTPHSHNGLGGAAEQAVESTQRMAHEALDNLADSVQDVRRHAGPSMQRANERALALARRGVDAVRDRSQRLRYQAGRAAYSSLGYVKEEPVKSALYAAAGAAVLVALVGWALRRSDRD